MSEVNAVTNSYDPTWQAQYAARDTSSSFWTKALSLVGKAVPVLGGALDLIGVKTNSSTAAVMSPEQSADRFMEMLAIQQQIQMESQIFTTATNVSKARHEADMAAVRNIR
jgi:hypothetical protein